MKSFAVVILLCEKWRTKPVRQYARGTHQNARPCVIRPLKLKGLEAQPKHCQRTTGGRVEIKFYEKTKIY